jgi:hypothetical protein
MSALMKDIVLKAFRCFDCLLVFYIVDRDYNHKQYLNERANSYPPPLINDIKCPWDDCRGSVIKED